MVGGTSEGEHGRLLEIYLHLAQRSAALSFSVEIKVKPGQMAGVNKKAAVCMRGACAGCPG